MILLIDIGNSRLKWRVHVNGELSSGGEIFHNGELSAGQLSDAWATMPVPKAIWCVNVAVQHASEQLTSWTIGHWQRSVNFVGATSHSCGLRNGYQIPERLGADRWVAMLGAQQLYPGAVCVADCGTAVTIDCIDAEGQHQGGLILPGLQMMPRCVTEHTSRVVMGPQTDSGWLGRDTTECLTAGAYTAIAATLAYTSHRFETELSQPVSRVITGGDADSLMSLLDDRWHHEPTLIFIGLARLAGEVVR